jgi:hypothetical protein
VHQLEQRFGEIKVFDLVKNTQVEIQSISAGMQNLSDFGFAEQEEGEEGMKF